MMTRRRDSHLGALGRTIGIVLLLVFAVGPILVLFFNALKTNAEVGSNPFGLPANPRWENFPEAWDQGGFSTTVVNSLLLVGMTVAAVLILAGAAAYALSRLEFSRTGALMAYLLVVSTLPIQMFLVPLFSLWRTIGLLNTLPGVALIYVAVNSPLAVLLLRSYLVQLPADFEDAARVDGANEWQVLWRVVIPLTWPGFLTTGLVVALAVWNEFLIATLFLTDQKLFTVVTSYFAFTSRFSRDWGLTSAAAVIMLVPVVLLFFSLQRRFIEGLTQGGLNG